MIYLVHRDTLVFTDKSLINFFFSGQVVDALATPIVGLLADRYGTKKAWHLAGKLKREADCGVNSFLFY